MSNGVTYWFGARLLEALWVEVHFPDLTSGSFEFERDSPVRDVQAVPGGGARLQLAVRSPVTNLLIWYNCTLPEVRCSRLRAWGLL